MFGPMLSLIALLAVVAMFVLSMAVMNLLFAKKQDARKRMRRRLESLGSNTGQGSLDIERRRQLSEVEWLDKALARQSWTSRIDLMLERGQVNCNVGTLVLVACIGAAFSLYAAFLLTDNFFLRLVPAAIFFYAPFMWAKRRCNKRMAKFQRQLPDALDLIARALKAGHAFPQGMKMVADEFEDPIGPEFEKTLDEISFGVSVEQALFNLTARVDCPDLKFFVVSVNIQRETGGNLSEIVGNIARLVRERFVFQGRVKVLAAEGKLTAYILFALPFAVGLVINIINPEYMSALYTTAPGRMIMTMAFVLMGVGAAALKKLITIKV